MFTKHMHDQFLEIPPNSTQEQLEEFGTVFAHCQLGVMWWIGDLARYAESRWPETWHQVFPPWISPGLVDRCKGVARAYPNESDRFPQLTWATHMQNARRPDRQAVLARLAEECVTTDEARLMAVAMPKKRWLLAVDVHYHLHRHWFSGADVEAAVRVTEWVQRTVSRLKEKGLTDCVCAFDSKGSFRKELTVDWEKKYKDRPPKDPELVQQLTLVRELLDGAGFLCVSADGFEADDVIATYAATFDGKVTILGQDKDLKQCLSESCNMLLDVEWTEDFTSGEMIPEYKWLSAKQHTADTGITPKQWPDYQAIMGDNVDGISGAEGIGAKGAADLIKEFQTLDNVLVAAKAEHKSIKPKKRESLLEFEKTADVVRKLVTLRTDVPVSGSTLLA